MAEPVASASVVRDLSSTGARTAAMVAMVATSGSSPTTTSRRCSRSVTTRTARPATGCTARARTCTADVARVARDQGARGTVFSDMYTGDLLAELVQPRRPLDGRAGRTWRPRQRQVPVEQAACSELRRAGRTRRGTLAQDGAAAHGRRRSGRIPERRQVDAHQRDLGGEAEDRELSVHHARAESRRGESRRRNRVRRRRHSRSDRRCERRQGTRPSVPASHRASAGAVHAWSISRPWTACRRRSRSGCCCKSSVSTNPTCSSALDSSSVPKPMRCSPTSSRYWGGRVTSSRR